MIPLWVRLPNLPLNCWGPDSLTRVGSLLGVPLYADECTTAQLRVSFARVLVEMDITSPLPDVIWIEDAAGNLFKQKVEYDWRPSYCKICHMAGHNCDQQPALQQPRVQPKITQIWMPKQTTQPAAPPSHLVATHLLLPLILLLRLQQWLNQEQMLGGGLLPREVVELCQYHQEQVLIILSLLLMTNNKEVRCKMKM